jgi:hypothetical protein
MVCGNADRGGQVLVTEQNCDRIGGGPPGARGGKPKWPARSAQPLQAACPAIGRGGEDAVQLTHGALTTASKRRALEPKW